MNMELMELEPKNDVELVHTNDPPIRDLNPLPLITAPKNHCSEGVHSQLSFQSNVPTPFETTASVNRANRFVHFLVIIWASKLL